MQKEKETVEFIEQGGNKQDFRKGSLKDLLDGNILTRKNVIGQFPFLLFLAFIAMIYTANRYHAEKVVRRSVELQNRIKELRSESITISTELMQIGREYNVLKSLRKQDIPLEEPDKPVNKIIKK